MAESPSNSRKKLFDKKKNTEDSCSPQKEIDTQDLDEDEIIVIEQLDDGEQQMRDWVNIVNANSSSDLVAAAYDHIEKEFRVFLGLKANKYFIKGGDVEDVIQEGRIGLHKAIKDFDESRGMKFVSFACMCIERHLVSTIKRGLRYKTEILNESQSLDQRVFVDGDDGDDAALLELLEDERASNPEGNILEKEQLKMIKGRLFRHLTVMEYHVTEQYLRGRTYKEIADVLEIKPKAVDNAISRVKDKAKEINIADLLKSN